jgi:hypothetical protein
MAKRMMDDLVFNQILCTEGYKVEYVVGTTYSLDLTSFISLPFSLGFLEEPDEVMKGSLTYLYTALKLCTDKLAVFCNYSDIKVPQGTKKVYYSLLENSIFGINASPKGRKKDTIVNFHPKVWIIQESKVNGEDQQVKVIVMSRNLTGDNSLDVVCELVGKMGTEEASESSLEKHRPLCDFLKYLSLFANKDKQKMINHLIDAIRMVKKFDIEDSPFDDYDFLPMGIKNYDGKDCAEEMAGPYETVVVSPFIDDKTILRFADAKNKTLITREFSITPEILNAFGKENIYIVNQNMIDNEENDTVDLHAKMYYVRCRGHYTQYVYLGSANATGNGFGRNVEFLLRLRYAPYKGSYETFRENFINDDRDCKFSRMVGLVEAPSDASAEYKATLRLRYAINAVKGAAVKYNSLGTYDVTIVADTEGIEDGVILYPLMSPEKKCELKAEIVFDDMSLESLSEFYVIETAELKRMIKVETKGIPETRDEAICRKIMNRNQFLDCISFLLSDNKKAYLTEKMFHEELGSNRSSDDVPMQPLQPAIYENLLRSAYDRPNVFNDIRTFVSSLPADLIPVEFNSLYEDIVKAFKSVKR